MEWMDTIGANVPEDDYVKALGVSDPSEDWQLARLGRLTGSQLGTLVKQTRDRKGYEMSSSQTAEKLLYRIAWERLIDKPSNGLQRLNFSSRITDHGNDYELTALGRFTEVTGIRVVPGGYNFIKMGDFFGGTPDGDTEDGGIIEAKCPWDGGNHLWTLEKGQIYNPEHFYQIQGYLLLTNKPHAWYVTYDPDLPEGLDISILKVDRDETVIDAIKIIIEQARGVVEQMIKNTIKKANIVF